VSEAKSASKSTTKSPSKTAAKSASKSAPKAAAKSPTRSAPKTDAKTGTKSPADKTKKAPAKAAAADKAAPEIKSAEKPRKATAEKKPAPEKKEAPEKKPAKPGFAANEFIVYPAHGVGKIVEIQEQEVAGHKLELFVINFDKDKMTLRVPTNKVDAVGMRKLADSGVVDKAISTLGGRARVKRTMWSRRAQEYEAKINSGDLISIAEVVRDLYRSERQPEQSYSERQLYEAALDRMARELAAVESIGETDAVEKVEAALEAGASKRAKDTPSEAA